MPNLKDIKRRIVSVEKTQQITRAMRMVSAAKLRRATEATEASKPYADRMRDTLGEVTAAGVDFEHPLLEVHEQKACAHVVVISSDRGLAGAFNSNVGKMADAVLGRLQKEYGSVTITTIGRKASEYYRRHRGSELVESFECGSWVEYARAAELARSFARRYASAEADAVVLVYNEFVNTMTQRPIEMQLLPFTTGSEAEPQAGAVGDDTEEKLPYEIEPSPEQLLSVLIPKAVEIAVFRSLLENQAGEHAARMTAMESATRNTEELIDQLTLDYNRARQAAITKELVEIVTGAQALEG